jgi:hypothetical protein
MKIQAMGNLTLGHLETAAQEPTIERDGVLLFRRQIFTTTFTISLLFDNFLTDCSHD